MAVHPSRRQRESREKKSTSVESPKKKTRNGGGEGLGEQQCTGNERRNLPAIPTASKDLPRENASSGESSARENAQRVLRFSPFCVRVSRYVFIAGAKG